MLATGAVGTTNGECGAAVTGRLYRDAADRLRLQGDLCYPPGRIEAAVEGDGEHFAQPYEGRITADPFQGRRPGSHHGAAALRKDGRVRSDEARPSASHAPPRAGARPPRSGNAGRPARKAQAVAAAAHYEVRRE